MSSRRSRRTLSSPASTAGATPARTSSIRAPSRARLREPSWAIPALAPRQPSNPRPPPPPHWETATRFGPDIIRRALEAGIPRDVLINVNFPDCSPDEVKGISITSQGRHQQGRLEIDSRKDGRGNAYYWIAYVGMRGQTPADGSDVSALADNRIAVTPLRLNMPDTPFMTKLAQAFGERSVAER